MNGLPIDAELFARTARRCVACGSLASGAPPRAACFRSGAARRAGRSGRVSTSPRCTRWSPRADERRGVPVRPALGVITGRSARRCCPDTGVHEVFRPGSRLARFVAGERSRSRRCSSGGGGAMRAAKSGRAARWSGGRIERIELREQRRARGHERGAAVRHVRRRRADRVCVAAQQAGAGCSRVTSSSHSTRARASCGSSRLPASAGGILAVQRLARGRSRAARRLPAAYLEVATSRARADGGRVVPLSGGGSASGSGGPRPAAGCRWCGDEVVRQDGRAFHLQPRVRQAQPAYPRKRRLASRRAAGR